MGNSSSPQSANRKNSSSREGTFKRSISCGTQFPKRRKVGVFEDHNAADVFTESMKGALSKPSRVSELLDGIKVAAVSPDKSAFTAVPSSSSPIPRSKGWSERKEIQEASPLRPKDCYATGDTAIVTSAAPPLKLLPGPKDNSALSQNSSPTSSDYRDFDADELDGSTLDALGSNQTSIQATQSPITNIHPKGEYAKLIRPVNAQNKPITTMKPIIVSPSDSEEEDEFADSDEEIFAANLEEIFSKYDTFPDSIGTSSQSALNHGVSAEEKRPNTKPLAAIADSDDEYGDDLDDTDFAVAEESATQAMQNSASIFANVCTAYQ
jgi:hypothetical protein